MALLGTIRNRFGWIMMALIFMGMLSFLFMDISPGANASGSASLTVGYVNSDKISNDLVQQYSQEYQGNQLLSEQISEFVWDRIVREKLVAQRADEAGMKISPLEMGDLLLSSDPALISPIIKQYFGDPQRGGMVNTEDIKQRYNIFHDTKELLKQAEGDQNRVAELLEQQKNWFNLERTIEKSKLQDNFFKAISNGVYTPNWLVEMDQKLQKTSYNFDFVRIPYTNINEPIEIADEALTAYIEANPRVYKKEATATVSFVSFDVFPTQEDSSAYLSEMEMVALDFNKSTTNKDDSNVVDRNYGSFMVNYFTKDEMKQPTTYIDSLFEAENGTVFGPFFYENQYKVVKKIDEKELPDSVKSRHILIKATNPQEGQAARIKLDSLKKVLETDPKASFDSLALKFSDDGSKVKGGDLGWKAKDGSFVPQFEEYMFYTGEKDSLSLIYTQFGVHLMQITGYKFETDKVGVRIAEVSKDIIPGEMSTEEVNRLAIEFITEHRDLDAFNEAIKVNGMAINTSNGLEDGGYSIEGIGLNSTSADIIRWAHDPETQLNEVTNRPFAMENNELNFTEKFIVPVLVSRTPKGLASIEDPKVKADVDRILRNEKKTELVKSKLTKLTNLEAVAAEFGVIKETATNIIYETAYLNGIGADPKVAALASKTKEGEMSAAVGGKEGVYVLQLTSVVDAPPVKNVNISRKDASRKAEQMLSQEAVYQALKDNSDVIDSRMKY